LYTYSLNWKVSVLENTKLSLYKYVKIDFCTEYYVTRIHNKRKRSLLVRLRAGCLDLEIETGRWRGIPREQRICKLCNIEVEDELHFLFRCCKLQHIRALYKELITYLTISEPNDIDRFKFIFSKPCIITTSNFVKALYDERKTILYITT
jgi:hypothetical protein